MSDANLGIIILCAAAALILGGGIGFLIGRSTGKEKERIEELETQVAEAKKDMEVYRVQVNAHFKKTSELFHNMTDSYKAVYMHLADGSQSLCTAESAMLRPADNGFLALSHVEKETPHDDENSSLPPEESFGPEKDAAPPETVPPEFNEEEAALHEDDRHLDTVEESADLFSLETEEISELEEHARVDEKAVTEEISELKELSRVNEEPGTEGISELEELARVDEKAETSDESLRQETGAGEDKEKGLV